MVIKINLNYTFFGLILHKEFINPTVLNLTCTNKAAMILPTIIKSMKKIVSIKINKSPEYLRMRNHPVDLTNLVRAELRGRVSCEGRRKRLAIEMQKLDVIRLFYKGPTCLGPISMNSL